MKMGKPEASKKIVLCDKAEDDINVPAVPRRVAHSVGVSSNNELSCRAVKIRAWCTLGSEHLEI
jgi:hypothetical protein